MKNTTNAKTKHTNGTKTTDVIETDWSCEKSVCAEIDRDLIQTLADLHEFVQSEDGEADPWVQKCIERIANAIYLTRVVGRSVETAFEKNFGARS